MDVECIRNEFTERIRDDCKFIVEIKEDAALIDQNGVIAGMMLKESQVLFFAVIGDVIQEKEKELMTRISSLNNGHRTELSIDKENKVIIQVKEYLHFSDDKDDFNNEEISCLLYNLLQQMQEAYRAIKKEFTSLGFIV